MMSRPGDSELQDLYRELLLDYSSSASHKGLIKGAELHSHGINPVCGDEIELTLNTKAGAIDRLRYEGHGCVISQASCAMMAESLEGLSVEKARSLASAFKEMMLSKASLESLPAELEIVRALEGVRRFPMRVKCATLAWNTLLQMLAGPKGHAAEFQEVEG
ncbi:MAG: SUF system NifU family Fe-S cluster assembly protein [Elusimicrobia bacterium]|nr:SUF system NifU family Fe-S cluster assembly protein [Elusimicrobiota bacterium]